MLVLGLEKNQRKERKLHFNTAGHSGTWNVHIHTNISAIVAFTTVTTAIG